jgi:type II secretion system (T2SS) protein E
MSETRTIGQILTSVGRISEDDVSTALDHQREHGGYFGEALMSCGLVTQEELDWGLASQFDIPYVFPDADAVDPSAAALVSPEWALANLTLPILMTETNLKVVVDSPMKTEAVQELAERTGLIADVALASPSAIRDLIRQVFARASAIEEAPQPPVDLSEMLDRVALADAPRFGISARGLRASAWWDDHGKISRAPLSGDWRSELERVLIPGPAEMTAETSRTEWAGDFHRAGVASPVQVDYIADESGREYLFKPRATGVTLEQRFSPPPEGVVSEIRLLARSGTARFIVAVEPVELGHSLLPHLPAILLDPSWRSIYIHARDQTAAEEAFSLRMPDDPATWSAEIEALRSFHFDVVTVDLSGGEKAWAESALDVASVAFLLWSAGDDARPAYAAGIRWRLRIDQCDDEHLEWSLEPLHS